MTLGQAYWLTRDERYARIFVAHLEAWMDANPPKLGINWASSLEVAFRSISWLWAFYFFKSLAITVKGSLRTRLEVFVSQRAASRVVFIDLLQSKYASDRRSSRPFLSLAR